MTEGKIIRVISGFYDVVTDEGCVRLRAKGSFRKKGIQPLVGDLVRFEPGGLIEEILPRQNTLVRPSIANIDQAVIVLAVLRPEPSFLMLERMIAQVRQHRITPILVFNKIDQFEAPSPEEADTAETVKRMIQSYEKSGFTVLETSSKNGTGMDKLRELLRGKVSVFAGPSGVGKSSLMNCILPETSQEVGSLSEKLQRGKNTTRVSELWEVPALEAWIADTPGFTSLSVQVADAAALRELFPEWKPLADRCAYEDCTHTEEPGCAVRQAVTDGQIERIRYDGYIHLFRGISEND